MRNYYISLYLGGVDKLIEYFLNRDPRMSQAEIGRAVGVSQQRVQAVLRKGGPCPAAWVIPLCRETGWAIRPFDVRPDLYPDPDWIPRRASGGASVAA